MVVVGTVAGVVVAGTAVAVVAAAGVEPGTVVVEGEAAGIVVVVVAVAGIVVVAGAAAAVLADNSDSSVEALLGLLSADIAGIWYTAAMQPKIKVATF